MKNRLDSGSINASDWKEHITTKTFEKFLVVKLNIHTITFDLDF